MHFTIEQQLNAILRHCRRNNAIALHVEIAGGYKGNFSSKDGFCVFVYFEQNAYYTLASIAQR